MAILTAGNSSTITLTGDQYITASSLPNAEWSFTVTPVGAGAITNTQTAGRFGPPAVDTKQLGPFGMPVTLVLTCSAGSVTYAASSVGQRFGALQYVTMNGHKMPKTRRAVARVRAGNGTAAGRWRIATIGDSTTAGAGAGTSGTTNIIGAAVNNYPTRLASCLAVALGCTGQVAAVEAGVGNAGSATIAQYDSRVAIAGGTVAGAATYACPTGQMIIITNGGTYTFTPGYSFDTLAYGYMRNSGLGTLTPTIGAGTSTPASQSTVGGFSCQAGSFAFSAANTSVTITGSVANSYTGWFLAYDSTKSGVDIIPCCKWGGVANDFTSTANPWSTGVTGMWNTMSLDTVILQLTINDSNNGTSLATYRAKMQAIIDNMNALTNTPDIIIMSGWPSGAAAATNGTLDAFRQICMDLAQSNGLPYIAFGEARIGAYADYSDWYMGDAIHPLAVAYAGEGDFLAKTLLEMVA